MAKINGQDVFFPSIVLKDSTESKVAMIPRGEKFYIKPGMLALAFPWDDHTSFHSSDDASVLSNIGATFAWASERLDDNQQSDANGTNYRIALIYVTGSSILSGTPVKNNHNLYTIGEEGCYFQNDDTGTDGTGYMYVHYLE